MDIIKYETMIVTCKHCHTSCLSNSLSDFKDCGNTYPPTVYFICYAVKPLALL